MFLFLILNVNLTWYFKRHHSFMIFFYYDMMNSFSGPSGN